MERVNGKYLKEMREKHGYSLRVFAEKIYVSKSTVQRWEQSCLPENETVIASVADAFGLSVGDLLAQSDQYNRENGLKNAGMGAENAAAETAVAEKEAAVSIAPAALPPGQKREKISLKAKLLTAGAAVFFIALFFLFLFS